MRISAARTAAIILVAAALSPTVPAMAQDDMAQNAVDAVGVPMPPGEAAGAWVVESQGRSLCRLTLGGHRLGSGLYGAQIPGDCGDVLPPGVAGWKPVTDGMAFVDDQGRVLVDFNRWSPSLLVSRRSSGTDVQLRRPG